MSRPGPNHISTAFRKDGNLFAVSDDKGLIKIRDVARRVDFRQIREHKAPVYAMNFVENSQNILTAGDDNVHNINFKSIACKLFQLCT
jgi:WD40 repeat protein